MPPHYIGLILATWLILSVLVAGWALKWNREPASWFSLAVVMSPVIAGVALLVKGKGRKEARAHTRLEVQLKGEGTFNIEGKELQLEVVATDISVGGAYCLTDTSPEIGDKIKLHLRWSLEGQRSELVLNAVGTILRVDPQPEGNYGFAVKFDAQLLSG
jgi:hypothetical protein